VFASAKVSFRNGTSVCSKVSEHLQWEVRR
jgi:hypothetical protein